MGPLEVIRSSGATSRHVTAAGTALSQQDAHISGPWSSKMSHLSPSQNNTPLRVRLLGSFTQPLSLTLMHQDPWRHHSTYLHRLFKFKYYSTIHLWQGQPMVNWWAVCDPDFCVTGSQTTAQHVEPFSYVLYTTNITLFRWFFLAMAGCVELMLNLCNLSRLCLLFGEAVASCPWGRWMKSRCDSLA